jgi:hypothetical protein
VSGCGLLRVRKFQDHKKRVYQRCASGLVRLP